MKIAAAVVIVALALPSWWRETNSHASSARGARTYEKKKYPEAVKAFEAALSLDPAFPEAGEARASLEKARAAVEGAGSS